MTGAALQFEARPRLTGAAGPAALRSASGHQRGAAWSSRSSGASRFHLWHGASVLRLARSNEGRAWADQGQGRWVRAPHLDAARLPMLPEACPAPTAKPDTELRLAFLVTPAARRRLEALPGMAGLSEAVDACLCQADLPFAMSGCARHIGLAASGVEAWPEPVLQGLALDPIGPWLRWAKQLAQDQAVASLRHAQRAHAVVVLADLGEAARAGRTSWTGYAPSVPAAEERGAQPWRRLVLVDAASAWTDCTLAHELGHLVGAGHAPAYSSASTLDELAASAKPIGARGVARPWARGWQNPRRGWQTVMGGLAADALIDYQTLPLWSEAGHDWLGKVSSARGVEAAGVAGVAEDARRWAEAIDDFCAEFSPASG